MEMTAEAKEAMRTALRARQQQQQGGEIKQGHFDSAAAVLARIGGDAPVIVVPTGMNLQSGNPAITLKDDGQVEKYKQMLTVLKGGYDPGVDVNAVLARVVVNSILVKVSLVEEGDEVYKCGVIWHEYGHVQFEAEESGTVFAHELRCLREAYDDDAVRSYIDNRRGGLKYYARYAVDPGLDALADVLGKLGLDLQGFRKKIADDVLANKLRKLVPDAVLNGTVPELKKFTSFTDDPPEGFTDGNEFVWGVCAWVCVPVDPPKFDKGQPIHRLRVVRRLDL